MKSIAFRLRPGEDLRTVLKQKVVEYNIQSSFIITCVGSLKQVTVRMAGAKPEAQDIQTKIGHFEIVSLVGTVSTNGEHLHISFSDETGLVQGGHLKEGTIVDTTAEVVIGTDESYMFSRELDDATGFDELVIS